MSRPRFKLRFTDTARNQLAELKRNKSLKKRLKAVRKTLGLMETNLRHPGLNTHEYKGLKSTGSAKVFEAYAESKTPAAYRIFWQYGSKKNEINILAITPHP